MTFFATVPKLYLKDFFKETLKTNSNGHMIDN
jgi:hypothetical protein